MKGEETWPAQFRENHSSRGQVAQSVTNESGNGWHTPIQSDVARAVPAPSPQPQVKPRAPWMRKMIINMQEQLAKRIAAANSRAQTENRAAKTPGAAASSSQEVSTVGPDLIGEGRYTLHPAPCAAPGHKSPNSSIIEAQGVAEAMEEAQVRCSCPSISNSARECSQDDARHNHSNSAWRKNTWADQGEDIIANKEAQQPTRCNKNMAAAHVTSCSHYGRILSPDPNECFRMGDGCIMAPSVNPVTHMMKRNLHTRAHIELGVPPTSSMERLDDGNRHRQGAGVKQALQQQQRGRSPDGQEVHADRCATPQQLTAIELTSIHSGPA